MATFEIKIALIGSAASGKKSVLNALLRDNYGGAILSKRKETQVFCYRANVTGKTIKESYVIPELKVTSEETLYLGEEKFEVKETTYDVECEKNFVETRSDTQFTFVVVPGGEKFAMYIDEKWDDFDAAFILIDGQKGFKSDDEGLLKIVKENLGKRNIPTLVLCNKIDDAKMAKHAAKIHSKVEKILGLEKNTSIQVFHPISALQAYAYRAGAQLSVYDFEDFDKDMMELVGKEYLGSKAWKNMTHKDRFHKTHEIVSDQKHFEDAMQESGFRNFLNVTYKLLGEAAQQDIIQKQINLSLSKLAPFQTEWISYTVFTAYQKQNKLLAGCKTPDRDLLEGSAIKAAFWDTYNEYENGTLEPKFFVVFPRNVCIVANPLHELMYFHKLVKIAGWEEEEIKVVDRMKHIVTQYLHFLIKREHETKGNKEWSVQFNISPVDWSIIWRSILLMSYDKNFCQMFGKEKIMIEELSFESMLWKTSQADEPWQEAAYIDDLILHPKDPEKYNNVVRLKIASSLSDPDHFGHPIFLLCEFLLEQEPLKEDVTKGANIKTED